MAGKTRTTPAHGPQTAKKPFKADKTQLKSAAAGRAAADRKPAGAARTGSGATGPNRTSAGAGGPADRKRKAEDEPEKAVVKTSLLNAPEEIDFPRGGGTTLTQVEVREAQLEGAREAEQEGADDAAKETEVIKDKSKAKRRKLERELRAAQIKEKNQLPKDAFRIEHLNYKRLIAGTKVLCQVVQVRPLELIVSLPNQLLGHIPITNISPEFTARLEAAGEESSDEEDEEEEEDSDDEEDEAKSAKGLPGLPALFHPGQWVVAAVVSSKSSDSKMKLGGRDGDESVRASRRIELSLEPEKVNEGIAKGDLKRGFTLPAAVHDVEDGGYTLSFGLPSLSSFLPFVDAKKLSPTRPLHVGQVVLCRITKMHDNERTVSVTVEKADLAATTLDSVSSITSLLPLQLVPALVTAVLPSGLNVKFHGFYDGTIDRFHLPVSVGDDLADHYKQGQKIKARLLWDSIATTPKKFALSMAPHIIKLDESAELEKTYTVGKQCKRVKVLALDDEWGLTCEILPDQPQADQTRGVSAFVHISRITDDHLNTIPKNGPWKVGSIHPGRVIGFSPVDNLVQLSLQPSVIEQAFLRVQDVKVGAEVKGTVKRLGDNALFVSIGGNVDGVVWPLHYADIRLKHPEKKFKPGQAVKARVFTVDAERNRVALTLKKQLLTTELPIITRPEEAKVGMVSHATVTKVLEKSVLVDFFGGVRALIPAAEAAARLYRACEAREACAWAAVDSLRLLFAVLALSPPFSARFSLRESSRPNPLYASMDAFPASVPPAYGQPSMVGPGGEPPKRAHLYVGNLSPRVTEYMLQEIFAVAGPVLGVKIIPDRSMQHGGINYGFVEYHEMRSAETALQALNGRRIFDLEVRVNWAYQNTNTQKEDLSQHYHLFVGDLSPEVNDSVLQKAFSAFGSLSDARVMWDANTGKSRGYGFLAFRDRTDAEQAINAMNGEWLGARAIRVNWANQKNNQGVPQPGGGPGMSSSGGPPPTSLDAVINQAPAHNTTVYVGNLVPYATQADLAPLFQSIGHVFEIRLQADRGFAFVKYATHELAASAIVNLNGTMVHGRPLKLSWGKESGRNEGAPGGYAQGGHAPQAVAVGAVPPQDPAAAAAAMAAWQAQYGAQWAAYVQQQQAMQQKQGVGATMSGQPQQ